MTLPNLAGVATADLVEKIGGGNFSASYINWSRTLHLLRTHAPGWLPEVVPANDGGLLHAAPVGCYLLIRFRNGDQVTPAVPQAVMDSRNAAIPRDKITARDMTDTHRRGICMAAAMTFGLAYELWAKMPLETGYQEPEPQKHEPKKFPSVREEAWLALNAEAQHKVAELATLVEAVMKDKGSSAALDEIDWADLTNEEKAGLAFKLSASTNRALKAESEARNAKKAA